MKKRLHDTFATKGFVTINDLVPQKAMVRLCNRLELVLSRRYETGIYPDEVYYRPGTTLDTVPRHIVNAWKCDRFVASIAMSARLSKIAAELFGWSSIRLAVDTVWFKPSSSLAIDYHREFEYFKSLATPEVANCWIALDNMMDHNGGLEFVVGSHHWRDPENIKMRRIFSTLSGREAVTAVGRLLKQSSEIYQVRCAAGACTFFDGRIWHGSEPNHASEVRRAYGLHWINGTARLGSNPHYLFGRYKLTGSTELNESFWPIVWSADGYRTPWVDAFIHGGPLGG